MGKFHLKKALKPLDIQLRLSFAKIHRSCSVIMGSKGRTSAYESVEVARNGIVADETIDLRSDTLTKPNNEMRQAMATAIVGDDVFCEDPTVKELEYRVASTLGKSKGLFVSSGTMGNLLAALVHCNERGSEMIVGDQAHMFCYEQGNCAQLGGIHSNQIPNKSNGTFEIEGVIDRIRADDFHYPKTKLVCVENTHNRCGGRVLPLDWLDNLGKVVKEYSIPSHLDGARIFNAGVALNQPVSRIAKDFSSVSVCFSKGLAAPIGSVLVGDDDFILKARRLRKALGGGVRQSGILAAACIYSLDHMVDRLHDDHQNAKEMAKIINEMKSPKVFVNYEDLETNIMMLNVNELNISEFCKRLGMVQEYERDALGSLISVKCSPWSESKIRLVTHVDISQEMGIKAAEKICLVLKEFTDESK